MAKSSPLASSVAKANMEHKSNMQDESNMQHKSNMQQDDNDLSDLSKAMANPVAATVPILSSNSATPGPDTLSPIIDEDKSSQPKQLSTSSQPQTTFLSLPTEVRIEIYKHAIIDHSPAGRPNLTKPIEPALLQVSREVRNEAMQTFYKRLLVIAIEAIKIQCFWNKTMSLPHVVLSHCKQRERKIIRTSELVVEKVKRKMECLKAEGFPVEQWEAMPEVMKLRKRLAERKRELKELKELREEMLMIECGP